MKSILQLVLVGAFICCRAVAAADAPPTQQAESWAKLPPDQWPQMVLTNQATFEGHTSLEGASCFLMKMPDSTVVVGTAKHLIKSAGGVDPIIALPDLDHVLKQWEVYPRTKSESAIQAKGLAEAPYHEDLHDWILLNLAVPDAKLPSLPLTPRDKPVQVGETVYLIGVPYSDKESAQNVYKGTVTARPFKHFFKYEFSPPVHISGFSGAPIVDSNGLLLGHGVSKFDLKQKDGLEVEFGGEDATVALLLWSHRNDQPPVIPAQVIHLDVPDGWVEKNLKAPNLIKLEELPSVSLYAEVFAVDRGNFDDTVDLAAYAELVKTRSARNSKLQNFQDTAVKQNKVGDREALEFDTTGSLNQLPLHYRHVVCLINGCYCEFVFWSPDSKWEGASKHLDDIIAAVK